MQAGTTTTTGGHLACSLAEVEPVADVQHGRSGSGLKHGRRKLKRKRPLGHVQHLGRPCKQVRVLDFGAGGSRDAIP
jgi:hypothetical protein